MGEGLGGGGVYLVAPVPDVEDRKEVKSISAAALVVKKAPQAAASQRRAGSVSLLNRRG